jgi:hypothetical protein
MQPSNSIAVLLVILLAVLNGKEIIEYTLWFRFKIRTFLKKQKNERKNKTNNGSRILQCERQGSL